jgi:Mrp family chromosome partitioning ATPase
LLLTRKSSSPAKAIAADCHVSIAAEIRRFVANGTRKILITSTGPGEGKSSVVFEVGRALARQPELRVVVVDTDQLRPSLHRLFGADAAGGLGELIQRAYGLDLSGKLPAEFGLGDWIELLQVQGRTGRLEVAEDGRALVLTLIKGAIVSIADRDAGADRRLGGLLTASGHMTPERRDQALKLATESGEPLGEIALRMGLVEAGALQAALRAQFAERLQHMLAMRQPRCTFTEITERDLGGAAVTRDAAAAAGWTKQSGGVLVIRERLKHPYLDRHLNAAIKYTESSNLKLVTCGREVFNLLEGSGPAALRCILEHLASMFDVVLVDSPPVALGSPAEAISEMVAGTIMVVQADRFEASVIRRAKDRLEKRGAQVLGVILNQVDLQQPDQSFHYYYLYYPNTGEGDAASTRKRRHRRLTASGASDELPPTLRARIDEPAVVPGPDGMTNGNGRTVAIALVLILVLGAFFAIRFGPWSQSHPVAHMGTIAPSAVASASAAAEAQPTGAPATAAPNDSSSASSTSTVDPSAAPSAAPSDSPSAAPAAPGNSDAFTISVGTFLEARRADTERRKVQTLTPLSASIQKVRDGGGTSYRVLVGRFASHAAAVKAASDLMGTGKVREALVLPATGTASN